MTSATRHRRSSASYAVPKERFHCQTSARRARYHTWGETTFSPDKQIPLPAEAGAYRFTGHYSTKMATLPSCRRSCGHPDPFIYPPQQFIEKPATNLYQKSTKKSLFCRYLAEIRLPAIGLSVRGRCADRQLDLASRSAAHRISGEARLDYLLADSRSQVCCLQACSKAAPPRHSNTLRRHP